MLTRLFGTRGTQDVAAALYGAAVAQARQPAFYRTWQVPDTVDGRFELVALHVFLALHRFKRVGPAGQPIAQALFDTMFADMDRSLREMGAGDLGVARRVKAMAQGFYGRVAAYETALAEPDSAALEAALRRNLYGTLAADGAVSKRSLAAIAAYMRGCVEALSGQSDDELIAGRLRFAEADAVEERH